MNKLLLCSTKPSKCLKTISFIDIIESIVTTVTSIEYPTSIENIYRIEAYPKWSVQSFLNVHPVRLVLGAAWAVGEGTSLLGPVQPDDLVHATCLTTTKLQLLVRLLNQWL